MNQVQERDGVTRRSFLETAGRLAVALGATLGFGSLQVMNAAEAKAASLTFSTGAWLHCSSGPCHYDGGTCRTEASCAVDNEEKWKTYRNLSGSTQSCWGQSSGPCGWKQCTGGAPSWATLVGSHWCCNCV